MTSRFKVAVIGGGILGCATAYFLSATLPQGSLALVEKELQPAQHASSRNTGKIHAPFLYDPTRKRVFARASYLGFELWREYAAKERLPFVQDGVLEVATDEHGVARLQKYLAWGEANGLRGQDLTLLDSSDSQKLEPNVRCNASLFCRRDASVDYAALTHGLARDAARFGCQMLMGRRAVRIDGVEQEAVRLQLDTGEALEAEYVINAAGGGALGLAQQRGLAGDFAELYFRGEYWRAPSKFKYLTKHSIYSVPKHPEYPFLDPHWIRRVNGQVDVGPNAVPVSGAYAYDWGETLVGLPRMLAGLLRTGALGVFLDQKFLSLAVGEWRTSLSKTAMIERVREFLPAAEPSAFIERGFSGIRSILVDRQGKFADDVVLLQDEVSLHILNYASPGATGALPMAALITEMISRKGVLPKNSGRGKAQWDPLEIAADMRT